MKSRVLNRQCDAHAGNHQMMTSNLPHVKKNTANCTISATTHCGSSVTAGGLTFSGRLSRREAERCTSGRQVQQQTSALCAVRIVALSTSALTRKQLEFVMVRRCQIDNGCGTFRAKSRWQKRPKRVQSSVTNPGFVQTRCRLYLSIGNAKYRCVERKQLFRVVLDDSSQGESCALALPPLIC